MVFYQSCLKYSSPKEFFIKNKKIGKAIMKTTSGSISIVLISFGLLFNFCSNSVLENETPEENPEYTTGYIGEYLGQEPPGMVAREFVREVFSTSGHLHSCPVFSPDGNLVIWTVMSPDYEVRFMERENNQWSAPEKAQFLPQSNIDSPIISPDGNKIYFNSSVPTEIVKEWNENSWYLERIENGWSEPKLLGEEVNSYNMHWQVSIANNGNLYFSGSKNNVLDNWEFNIIKAELVNGEYTKTVDLGSSINTTFSESNPFIDPDEQYIIFSRLNSSHYADLYISYKETDGSWTEAINMGNKINTATHELCPNVTRDGKYLFFMSPRRGDGEIYWIDSGIIEELKPEEMK